MKTRKQTNRRKLPNRWIMLRSRRNMLLFVLLFAAVGSYLIWKSYAQAPQTLSFSRFGGDIQYPVEQESPNFFFCGGSQGPIKCAFDQSTWVRNPTSCVWDVDDYIDRSGTGNVAGGTTATDTTCLIADSYTNYGGDRKTIEVNISSSSSNLQVSLVNSNGVKWAATPVAQKRGYLYALCIKDPTAGSMTFPVLANSNGGTGQRVDYTLSIYNPNKTTRSVNAGEQLTGAGPGLYSFTCPAT
ncbi:MAG TPA: hypothetical protein VLE74_00115 [Candidatus Saccharimonadales bacterium]|nr:hypothetical protein [Candidatus Saccharimonadales bacterium]